MTLLSSYAAARSSFHCQPALFSVTSFRSLSSSSARWNQQETPRQTDNEATPKLPPLNKPLGVRERPSTVVKSMKQKMEELLDTESLMIQRRHLVKEATKGYFHDMNMTRRNGGKTWIAPKALIREDKALYFPNINGSCLLDGEKKNTTEMCFGRISVIAMLGTRISEIHTQSFAKPSNLRYGSNPLYQFIQINVQENLLKSLLLKVFLRSLRSTVPYNHQANYLVSSQNLEYIRDPLGLTNSKVGYVYLVDENLKVRWAGCADAYVNEQDNEPQYLENCVGVLLKRLEENPKKAGLPTANKLAEGEKKEKVEEKKKART